MTTSTTTVTALLLSGLCGLAPAATAQGSDHHKLLPLDGLAGDEFGTAIAIDGPLVAVGAPRADDLGLDSGSAYLFGSLNGTQLLELVPTGGAAGDRFGTSIATQAGVVVVGAPYAASGGTSTGAAYVFDATTGLQLFELQAADGAAGDEFGCAVALDDGLIVVGALRDDDQGMDSGAAYVFDAATGLQLKKLLPTGGTSGDGFGGSVDIDSGLVAVGARTADGTSLFSGVAYLHDATTGAQLHKLTPLAGAAWDSFGCSVGIDGTTVVVGARDASPKGKHSGAAYLFDAPSGQQTAKLVPNDGSIFARFGAAVAVDGDHVAVGARDDNGSGFSSGAVYVFQAQDGSEVLKLLAGDGDALDELGGAVAAHGGVIVAGAAREDQLGDTAGAAYTFDGGAAVSPMTGCLSNAGSLVHVGGLPVGGHTLQFALTGAQPGASTALLFVAGAPVAGWPACGVDLGSAGELLIDVAPASLAYIGAVPYTGSPAVQAIPVPPLAGLAGLLAYAQGAFLAPTLPTEPLRLTNGLQLVLGGYL